jgi:hypothetical protein
MLFPFALESNGDSQIFEIKNHQNGAFGIQVTTLTATSLLVKVSLDGETYVQIPITDVSDATSGTSILAAGIYYFEVTGYQWVKLEQNGAGAVVGHGRFNLG